MTKLNEYNHSTERTKHVKVEVIGTKHSASSTQSIKTGVRILIITNQTNLIDCYSYAVCALQVSGPEVEKFKLICGLWDFPVAIGCCEAVKCPVKPPTRLCSRRSTGPEMRDKGKVSL